MIVPIAIGSRPFSVEMITGLMLPNGIFDSSLQWQSINCYVTNTSNQDLKNIDVYLEGIGDAGIRPNTTLQSIPLLRSRASYLCSWPCDFSLSSPGKPFISIRAHGDGFSPARILKRIFVSRTRYDAGRKEYVCQVPEGVLKVRVTETSGPPVEYASRPGGEAVRKFSAGPWIIRAFSSDLTIGLRGQYGPLAFADPWWKVVAWVVVAIAAIVAVIAASTGHGTASAGVQCDYDEKTGQTSNCRSPDPEPTTGPTETSIAAIASAVAAGAVKVGMSDEIDPWRRGQAATIVSPDETTTSERLDVSFVPLDDLEPGKPFRIQLNWLYSRITDKGAYHASAQDIRTNTHLLGSKVLTVPRRVSVSQDSVMARASLTRADGSPYRGPELYVTLVVRPPAIQGGEFRAILTDPDERGEYYGYFKLEPAIQELRRLGQNYLGNWRLYVIAQDVNLAPDGLPPIEAAQIIGGFPIAGPAVISLKSGVCAAVPPDALMLVY
jgi:hypothetical protein